MLRQNTCVCILLSSIAWPESVGQVWHAWMPGMPIMCWLPLQLPRRFTLNTDLSTHGDSSPTLHLPLFIMWFQTFPVARDRSRENESLKEDIGKIAKNWGQRALPGQWGHQADPCLRSRSFQMTGPMPLILTVWSHTQSWWLYSFFWPFLLSSYCAPDWKYCSKTSMASKSTHSSEGNLEITPKWRFKSLLCTVISAMKKNKSSDIYR